MIKITPDDKRWLREKQPGIIIMPGNVVEGNFHIRAIKGEGEFGCTLYPTSQEGEGFVDDFFYIRACFAGDMPRVYETGGRFERLHKKKSAEDGKSIYRCMQDMHIHENGQLCLGHSAVIPVILRKHPGIQGVFEHLLAPYFYFHAYWEKYRCKPWKDLSHKKEIASLEQIYFSRNNRDELKACLREAKDKGLVKKLKLSDALHRGKILLCRQEYMPKCHPEAFKGAGILLAEARKKARIS